MNGLIRLIIFSSMFAICMAVAQETELIGQGNDGNRSISVHVIELFDDNGDQIKNSDATAKPFSARQTCGQCHDYQMISRGWHFNSHDPNITSGRPGQPWVLTDSKTRTQIPISARNWEGVFLPEELNITPWEFVKMNFSHFPGGGYGEIESEEPDEIIRQEISGKYEINCLVCHHADPHQDQSEAAMQSARQNYRWIAAGSSGKATISGVASSLDDFFDPEFDKGVEVDYQEGIFNSENKVFFDITNHPDNERCYFCHSNQNLSVSQHLEWTRDEDVHLKAGLLCVDCHRNGDNHMITRGVEADGLAATLTCEGCHIGIDDKDDFKEAGRLGAPKPTHRGIPTVHFEKLTCTACHSGPWPNEKASRWRTARVHKTGLHGKHDLSLMQPHVFAPVLMEGSNHKIAPHKLFWPSYWGILKGTDIEPIAPEIIRENVTDAVLNDRADKEDHWQPLTEEQITSVLTQLSSDQKKAVYIAGGKMYKLADGKLSFSVHDAAKPYAWPLAHDVRPAGQSLGVRNCKDCHTTDSPFFFGKVEIDTPVKAQGVEFVEMVRLQGIDRLYIWLFNASFIFRPMLKIIAFVSCAIISVVILAYLIRGIGVISSAFAEEEK